MSAGRRHLERALGGGLAPDVGEVARRPAPLRHERRQIHLGGRQDQVAGQVGADFDQGAGAADLEARHDCRLRQVVVGEEQPAAPGSPRRQRHRKRAANGAEIALEADLAERP